MRTWVWSSEPQTEAQYCAMHGEPQCREVVSLAGRPSLIGGLQTTGRPCLKNTSKQYLTMISYLHTHIYEQTHTPHIHLHFLPNKHINTHIRAHIYTYTNTSHILKHTYILALTYMCIQIYLHKHVYIYMPCICTHMYFNTHLCTHTNIPLYTCTYTCTHLHTHPTQKTTVQPWNI